MLRFRNAKNCQRSFYAPDYLAAAVAYYRHVPRDASKGRSENSKALRLYQQLQQERDHNHNSKVRLEKYQAENEAERSKQLLKTKLNPG